MTAYNDKGEYLDDDFCRKLMQSNTAGQQPADIPPQMADQSLQAAKASHKKTSLILSNKKLYTWNNKPKTESVKTI